MTHKTVSEKIAEIKKDMSKQDTSKPINPDYTTNFSHYVEKMVDHLIQNPTHTYFNQNEICKNILGTEDEPCDVEIAIAACQKLTEGDYGVLSVIFEHNSYDDRNNEVTQNMEQDEFIKAYHNPDYTPIDEDTGHPMEFYVHRWITFYCLKDPERVEHIDDLNF